MASRFNAIDGINRKYRGSGAILPPAQITQVVAPPQIVSNVVHGGLRRSLVVGTPSTLINTPLTLARPSTTLISGVSPVIGGNISGIPVSTIQPTNYIQTHTVRQ